MLAIGFRDGDNNDTWVGCGHNVRFIELLFCFIDDDIPLMSDAFYFTYGTEILMAFIRSEDCVVL